MDADPNVLVRILGGLRSPQIQAAIIAAVVSLIVGRLTTRRDRRARRVERANKLLQEVYNPLDTFLKQKSLSQYMALHEGTLERNRHNFTRAILPLIDEALRDYVPDLMTFGETRPEVLESQRKLQDIATRLGPLITREVERLQGVVAKEAG